MRSPAETRDVSLSTAGTAFRFNRFELCCRELSKLPDVDPLPLGTPTFPLTVINRLLGQPLQQLATTLHHAASHFILARSLRSSLLAQGFKSKRYAPPIRRRGAISLQGAVKGNLSKTGGGRSLITAALFLFSIAGCNDVAPGSLAQSKARLTVSPIFLRRSS